MRRAKPVWQQWIFDDGWADFPSCAERDGVSLEMVAPLGSPRDLFDGDGPLIRKVSLGELERMCMDGASQIQGMLGCSGVGALILVDDRPASTNPVIATYRDATLRGIAAVVSDAGVSCTVCREERDD